MNYKERQETIASSPISFKYLKRFNIAAGVLHLVQGITMLALGLLLDWSRDIYTFYLDIDIISISPPVFEVIPKPQIVFTFSFLGAILASFPLISALAHYDSVNCHICRCLGFLVVGYDLCPECNDDNVWVFNGSC